jgi:hypothetical protein
VDNCLSLRSFRLGFGSSVIDELVAMMVLWNKVSPVSPYLDDVRSGIGERLVRVWSVRSVDLFKILAVVCLSEKALVGFRCGDLDLFFWSNLP